MWNSETSRCSTSNLLPEWNINLCLEARTAVNSWLYNVYIQCMDKYDCLIYCLIQNNVLLDGRIITPFTIGLEQTTMKAAKGTFSEQHYKNWTSGNSGQKVQLEKLFLKMFVYVLLRYVEQALVLVLRYSWILCGGEEMRKALGRIPWTTIVTKYFAHFMTITILWLLVKMQ